VIGGEIAHTWQNCDFRLQSRDVSGSYAEPGTKTLRTDRNRGQIIAECRYCGLEIFLDDDSRGARWCHLSTGDAQCQPVAQVSA